MTGSGLLGGVRVVVTGAASGIGRATAVRLGGDGAAVACLDRDRDGVDRVVGTITAAGGRAVGAAADVTVEDEVRDAIEEAVAAFGGLDGAVVNAAVQLFGPDGDRPAAELPLEVWRRTIDVNLTGAFLTSKHAVAALLRSRAAEPERPLASLVFTGSPTGLFGLAPGFDAYSSSKGGMIALARVLAADYGPQGIRVNTVIPGFTDTPLVTEITGDAAAQADLVRGIPLGRPGRAEEVAAMMSFLLSDDASYVTGAILPVDGGMTAI